MYSNCAPRAVTIHQRILRPPAVVRTNAATTYHFLHSGYQNASRSDLIVDQKKDTTITELQIPK